MKSAFSLSSMGLRFGIALFLVFTSYNPSGYSYVHWVLNRGDSSLPLLLLSGVVLIIGWVIFLRATLRSLGPIGIALAVALFACLIWLAIDFKVLDIASEWFVYVLLVVAAAVLAIGMSWSHIRRRMSGQADMDDVDE